MVVRRSVSKKAQISMGVKPIIGGILSAMVILATVGLFIGLMRIFVGHADQGTEKGYTNIIEGIEALYHSKNTGQQEVKRCAIMNLYGQPDFAFVGFHADGVKAVDDNDIVCKHGAVCVEENCFPGDLDNDKPVKCGSGPCLCLCDEQTKPGVGGTDCDTGGSVCHKLKAPGLQRLKYLGIWDFVIYTEECAGANKGTQGGIVLVKEGDTIDTVVFKTGDELKKLYEPYGGVITCRDLASRFRQKPTPKPGAAPPSTALATQGKSLDQQLEHAGAEQAVVAKPS